MTNGGSGSFRRTHRVPDGGLRAFGSPDAGDALSTALDAGLDVMVLEQRPEGWAQVEFSNGWRCWVDGRALVPAGTQTAPTGWTPTHRAPAQGMPAWDAPDPRASPAAQLGPRLEVQVTEQRPDGWARIICANGWSAWADGRRLESLAAGPTRQGTSLRARAWMPLVGGVLVLVSAFVPWYSVGPADVDATEIPLWFLVAQSTSADGPKVSPAVVIAALLILAAGVLPFVTTSRGVSRWMLLIGAAIATNLAVFAVGRMARPETGLSLAIGVPLIGVGGLLAALAHWMTRLSSKGAWSWLA